MPTVREAYKISEDELDRLEVKAEENDYWYNCYEFLGEVVDRDIIKLSDKQTVWLEKILEEIQ